MYERGYIMRIYIFLIPIIALSSHPLSAKDEIILEPSSNWVIDYANEACHLSRTFSNGDKDFTLKISRFKPNLSFELLLISKYLKRASTTKPVTIKFGTQFDEQEFNFKNGDTLFKDNQKIPTIIIRSSILIRNPTEQEIKNKKIQITAEDEDKVDKITIKARHVKDIILQTKTMKGAFAALRKCTDSLVTSWGYDAEEQNKLNRSVMPANNPSQWIKPEDYPEQQLIKRDIAVIQYRLDVDENGSAIDCVIQRSIGGEAFDRAVCQNIMSRAKFEPALDANNKPIKSYYISKVIFAI